MGDYMRDSFSDQAWIESANEDDHFSTQELADKIYELEDRDG